MGNQIILNVLTDLIDGVRKSPHAYAYLIANAWHMVGRKDRSDSTFQEACRVADEHGEPRPHPQCITAVAAFHASHDTYILAGGNTASTLDFVEDGEAKMEWGDRKGRWLKTVTLALPEYRQKLAEKADTRRAPKAYWERALKYRYPVADEVTRLVTALYGFFHRQDPETSTYEANIRDFVRSKYPWGIKAKAESIAFNLGWDPQRRLCREELPKNIEVEAMKLYDLVVAEIDRQETEKETA